MGVEPNSRHKIEAQNCPWKNPSQVILNRFARLACFAKQKDFAKSLMDQFGDGITETIWDGPINVKKCQEWLISGT